MKETCWKIKLKTLLQTPSLLPLQSSCCTGIYALCDLHSHRAVWIMSPGGPRQPWGLIDQCCNFDDNWSFLPLLAITHVRRNPMSKKKRPHARNSPDTQHVKRRGLLWLMDPCFSFYFHRLVDQLREKNRNSMNGASQCQFESRYVQWTALHALLPGKRFMLMWHIKNFNCKLADNTRNILF